MIRRLVLAAVVLLIVGPVRAADAKRPNILFAFADDWGRYAERLCEARRPRHRQRRACGRRTSTAWRGEGVLFRRAFVSAPSLHAVPQRPPLGPALLAHRPRGDPARRRLGRPIPSLPAPAARRRLSHRRDVQGLEPRHAGRCAVRRREVRLREGGPAASTSSRRTSRGWSPRGRRSRRPSRRCTTRCGRTSTPSSPTASRASRSATGSARRTSIASGSRGRARRCGASTRTR